MAALQKTYRGDLSTAIAGVLWSRIKEADTKKELEKSNASDDIKEAAVELGKEDPSDKSIPVQDKSLRDSVVRIFGKLEGRLFSLQGKANNISGKVTTLAGGIADTQDLIINQNQLLEDKFDIILKNIGAISSIDKKNAAESELDRVEAFDFSSSFLVFASFIRLHKTPAIAPDKSPLYVFCNVATIVLLLLLLVFVLILQDIGLRKLYIPPFPKASYSQFHSNCIYGTA